MTAESMKAAEAAGADVTPQLSAADCAEDRAHALSGAHGLCTILKYAPAAFEINRAMTLQPAVAGSADAASTAVATEGAGNVRDNGGQLTWVRGASDVACCSVVALCPEPFSLSLSEVSKCAQYLAWLASGTNGISWLRHLSLSPFAFKSANVRRTEDSPLMTTSSTKWSWLSLKFWRLQGHTGSYGPPARTLFPRTNERSQTMPAASMGHPVALPSDVAMIPAPEGTEVETAAADFPLTVSVSAVIGVHPHGI